MLLLAQIVFVYYERGEESLRRFVRELYDSCIGSLWRSMGTVCVGAVWDIGAAPVFGSCLIYFHVRIANPQKF